MKHKLLLGILLAGNFLMTSSALAVTKHDFEALTTQNLINLCTVSSKDPLAQQAIHFCQGYLVGAFDFHMAERKDARKNPWFCLPKPEPSRDKIVAQFVKWTTAHPEYMRELPVETEFRFLIANYPCNK